MRCVRGREIGYLRRDEITAYLAGCSIRYRPLAELLIGTGVRIGEAVAVQWGDVDWHGSAITVTRALKRSGVGSTKGKRTRRVEIGPRLLGVLRDLQAAQAEHRTEDDADALMFPAEHASHLDRSVVSRDWHPAALKAAGLRRTIRLHDLRHSAAAAWLASGLPMVYVQRQFGHAISAPPSATTATWRSRFSATPPRERKPPSLARLRSAWTNPLGRRRRPRGAGMLGQ